MYHMTLILELSLALVVCSYLVNTQLIVLVLHDKIFLPLKDVLLNCRVGILKHTCLTVCHQYFLD